MRLKLGYKAPDFEATDVNGREVTLKEFSGSKVMLSFYRYASCPLCNLRVHQLSGLSEIYSSKGLSMIAVFQSPAKSMKKYLGKQELPAFPLICDPERELYKKYKVETSFQGLIKSMVTRLGHFTKAMGKGYFPGKVEGPLSAIPADFLIGEDGIVEYTYYGRDIGDHLPLEKLDVWLSS